MNLQDCPEVCAHPEAIFFVEDNFRTLPCLKGARSIQMSCIWINERALVAIILQTTLSTCVKSRQLDGAVFALSLKPSQLLISRGRNSSLSHTKIVATPPWEESLPRVCNGSGCHGFRCLKLPVSSGYERKPQCTNLSHPPSPTHLNHHPMGTEVFGILAERLGGDLRRLT